jgi:hypothetical protein
MIVPTNVKKLKQNIDDEMSDTSENAVQNKVIKSYVDTTIDDTMGEALMLILTGGTTV